MKYTLKKTAAITLTAISLTAGSFFISANVMADETESGLCCNQVVQEIQNLKDVVARNFILLFGYMNALVEGNMDFSSEINSGAALEATLSNATTTALASTASGLTTRLTLIRDNNNYSKVTATMADLVPNSSQQQVTPEQLAPFNIGELLQTKAITSDTQQKDAESLIQFLSSGGNLPQLLADNYQNVDNASVNNFRTALGTYAATQSIATNTLNEMIAQRTRVPRLGLFIGLPDAASPLELQEKIATLPLSSDWTSKMATANPVDVQRETLFLISHLNYQIYQMNRNIEQMNVTNAGLLLQMQNGVNKNQLEALRQKAMKSVQN